MAVELHRYLADQLDRLPSHHPDRRFLEGLQEAVAGYVEQTAEPPQPAPAQDEAPAGARTAAQAAPTPERSAAPEQARVHLRGRVGYPPTFRTTPGGVLVGSFPLATHSEAAGDDTTWYRVFAFRERAEQLRRLGLTKGQAASVVGFAYDHTLTKRDGSTSVEHRVNAVAIKAR